MAAPAIHNPIKSNAVLPPRTEKEKITAIQNVAKDINAMFCAVSVLTYKISDDRRAFAASLG